MRSKKVTKNTKNNRAAGGRLIWRQIFVGFILLFFLSLISAIVWFGSRLEPLTIVDVSVEGTKTVSIEEVEKRMKSELDGTYYKMVPHRFTWTYPDHQIISDIKDIPRVKDVSLSINDGRILNAEITEYQPYALWCGSSSGSGCFFLDEEGYAFTNAPTLSGSLLGRYVDAGQEAQVGNSPFNYEFIKNTSHLVEVLKKEFNFKTEYILKTAETEATFHLVGGGKIHLTFTQSVEATIDNLRAILQSDELNHLEADNFEYIDLRFGDKVFVKELKNKEEDIQEETE